MLEFILTACGTQCSDCSESGETGCITCNSRYFPDNKLCTGKKCKCSIEDTYFNILIEFNLYFYSILSNVSYDPVSSHFYVYSLFSN